MINHFAASCYLLTLCLSINRFLQKGKSSEIKILILSAFFGAISVSIRPYYIAPTILLSIWLFIKNILINYNAFTPSIKYLKKIKLKKNFFILIIWIILLITFGFLINVSPYLPNSINYLIDGILHNSNSLQSQSINYIFKTQLFSLPFGSITFVISSITFMFSSIITFNFLKIISLKIIIK